MSSNDFLIYRANDLTLEGTVVDADGTAVDITGATIVLGARKDLLGTGLEMEKAGNVTGGPAGEFSVDLDPADTEELLGTYYYDVRMLLGGDYYTILQAMMTVLEVVIPPV